MTTGALRGTTTPRILAAALFLSMAGCYAHHLPEEPAVDAPTEVDASIDASVVEVDAFVPVSPGCGDGVLDEDEECDSLPGCLPDCRYSGCGPAVREGGSCDDGDPCTSDDRCEGALCVGTARTSHAEVISEVPNYEILGAISPSRLLAWSHHPESARIVDVTTEGLVVRASWPMAPQHLAPFGALDAGRRVAIGDRPLQLFDVSTDGELSPVGTPFEVQAGVYHTVGYASVGPYLYAAYYQLGSYLPVFVIIDTTNVDDLSMEVRLIGTAHQGPAGVLVSPDQRWLFTPLHGNSTSWPSDLVQWSLEDPGNPVEVRRIPLDSGTGVRVVASGVLLFGDSVQFMDPETGAITDLDRPTSWSYFVTPDGWAVESDASRGPQLVHHDLSRLPTVEVAEEISLEDLALDTPLTNWVGTLADDPSVRWVALSPTAFYRIDGDRLRGPLDATGLGAVQSLVADRDGRAFAIDQERRMSHVVDFSTIDAPWIRSSSHHGFSASAVRVRSGARIESSAAAGQVQTSLRAT